MPFVASSLPSQSSPVRAKKDMTIPSLNPALEPPANRPTRTTERETVPTPPTSPPPQKESKRTLVGSLIRWTLFIAAGAAAWYFNPYWLPWVKTYVLHEAPPPAPRPERATPVKIAKVVPQDIPVYLNGLGTITAYNTVTVKSRVDGELINVAFKEGQMVKQGDLLAEIDPRPYQMQVDQAAGKLVHDEAALKLAQVTLARQRDLMKDNATTPQQLDQQIAIVNQAEATLQIDKAAYENALLQLEYCRITAPISGRIGLRLVDQGNIVRANDPAGLMVITQLEPIALVFTIPQDEIPRVQRRMQQEGELVVEAYDRDFKTKLATGTLTAIDNQVDATTGTLRLKAMFKNEDHALFPNQFVNARLLVDVLKDALVVPSSAIQRGPESTYVYVVQPDNTVELRTVTTGPSEGTLVCVTSGVSEGELVVTDGLDKLHPKAKVILPESQSSESRKNGAPADSSAPGPQTERAQSAGSSESVATSQYTSGNDSFRIVPLGNCLLEAT